MPKFGVALATGVSRSDCDTLKKRRRVAFAILTKRVVASANPKRSPRKERVIRASQKLYRLLCRPGLLLRSWFLTGLPSGRGPIDYAYAKRHRLNVHKANRCVAGGFGLSRDTGIRARRRTV